MILHTKGRTIFLVMQQEILVIFSINMIYVSERGKGISHLVGAIRVYGRTTEKEHMILPWKDSEINFSERSILINSSNDKKMQFSSYIIKVNQNLFS